MKFQITGDMFGNRIKKTGKELVLGSIILGCSITVNAAELYKWIDADGNVTYQDTAPPTDVSYEEQTYADPDVVLEDDLKDSIVSAAEESPISLYSVPNCDACDLVRFYLDKNTIPFAEKDIENNLTMQQELRLKTGELRVPTLIIGDDMIDGYSKLAIRKSLIANGYPLERIENPTDPTIEEGLDNQNEEIETNLEDQYSDIEPTAEIQ